MADEQKRQWSEDELLDLTIDLIAEEGLSACTFRNLAKRAGVSTMTFTYRFGTRSNLIGEVLARAYSHGWEELRLGDIEGSDPVRRLYEIGLADLQLREEFDNYKRAYAEILIAVPRDPELLEALGRADDGYIGSFCKLIERAQGLDMIDPELDAETLSLAIWSVVDGLNINRYAYPDSLSTEDMETYFRRIFEGLIGRSVED
jgi:AcrR family transcriptional regulator